MHAISDVTLVLSRRCNYSCSYCPQRRTESALGVEEIRAFLEFLRPRLAREVWLGFYGGEPLLEWSLIAKTVKHVGKERSRRFRFTLTTNGSLLDTERILFLKDNRFALILSYDGLAQERRDASSVAAVEAALVSLRRLYPAGYTAHSVFGPETVRLLAASMEELMREGHRRLRFSLDTVSRWRPADLETLQEQLEQLAASCRQRRKQGKGMPLENFSAPEKRGIFACFSGLDRLALLPDRTVWGCEMFHTLMGHDPRNPDYSKYCFGKLEEFMSAPARTLAAVAANHADLRQDYFFTKQKDLCGVCADLERCAVCPAAAALASGVLAMIPSWTCRIRRITRAVASRFFGTATRPPGTQARFT